MNLEFGTLPLPAKKQSHCCVRIPAPLSHFPARSGRELRIIELTTHRLDESARLFLGGSLASVARLRFTGRERRA